MAVDRSVVGQSTGAWRVTVERGPVSKFAYAVGDANAVYHDRGAARAAGFAHIPAPPTFTFAMGFWGAFTEDQPADPTRGVNPMHQVMSALHARGALVLHGEQEFEYHRPVVVGDELDGEGRVLDIYEKETDTATMTFVVIGTEWTDAVSGAPVESERFNLIARLAK
jgi:acyl dehydratase